MNTSHAKSWLGKLALAACVLLLALVAMEVAARVYARVAFQGRLIVADKVVGWKLIPNARKLYRKETQPYFVSINSKGWRDAERSYDKAPGVYRIVAIGDSFVFGAGGVEAGKRFSDILEKSGKNVEVINMGVPGYGADQEYQTLEDDALKYNPDLVLLCAFYNDFSESFSTINPSIGRPKGYFTLDGDQLVFHPPVFSTFYTLSQYSYVLGVADLALSKISGEYWQKEHQQHLVMKQQTRRDTFKQIYRSADRLCRDRGIKFVIVYFPFQQQTIANVIQHVMGELAASDGVKTLDLMDTMRQADSARMAYFEHDIHFNEYGHEVVAKAIQDYLVGNSLLPSGLVQARAE
jgi:lysophospholipase L1-like esterase